MIHCRNSYLFAHQTKCIASQFPQNKRFIKIDTLNHQSSGNETEKYVPRRRVVVTGIGVVSPIGCDVPTAWNNILNGYCGIKSLDSQQYESLPCKIAAKISEEDLKLTEHFSKSELRSLAKTSVYALIAGSKAYEIQNSIEMIKRMQSDSELYQFCSKRSIENGRLDSKVRY